MLDPPPPFHINPAELIELGVEVAEALDECDRMADGDWRRAGVLRAALISGLRDGLIKNGAPYEESFIWLRVVLRAASAATIVRAAASPQNTFGTA